MDAGRWREIEELYHAALEREKGERIAFLDQVCAADPELRREVESLLAQDSSLNSVLDRPGWEEASRWLDAPATTPLSQGDHLGPYRIVGRLGAGGMGVVYEAWDTRLRRSVALKLLPEEYRRDPKALQRFQREARAASALNHPNIVTLFDIASDNGVFYLVMELVRGQTLLDLIPAQGLPIPELCTYGMQIAGALAAAHAAGIVHRDVKPANIIVTAEEQVKVLDFGLATLAGSPNGVETYTGGVLTTPGVVLGTLSYMSPEQARGERVDARSDVFSFGSLMYQALTGNLPFRGSNAVSILQDILTHDPPTPSAIRDGVPRALEEVILTCLRKDPAARFQRMSEVLAALRESQAAAQSAPAERPPSIVVLPFANVSADKDNEYFSDGLAEEILNALTQVPGLRVIARASGFAFRGREHAITEIGEKLRVTTVLHGSVRRAGERIRITAQLINVSDETQLWSERYDRELRDVFDIQDEIAQAIVDKLKIQLGAKAGRPLVKRYTENLEAHSLYLKGSFHLYRLAGEDLRKARDYLEQAVALEPGYAPAWVHLGDYYVVSSIYGRGARELWAKGLDVARKAVAADPDLAEAQAILGHVVGMAEYQWTEALMRLDTALGMNPASARVHFWRGWLVHCLGRAADAATEWHRAVDLDPLSSLYRVWLADLYLVTGQPGRAMDYARDVLDADPNYGPAMSVLGEAYSILGRDEEGIALLEKGWTSMQGASLWDGRLGWAYVRAGRRSEAERFLADIEERHQQRRAAATVVAMAAAALGDVESALRWVRTAFEERDPNLQSTIRTPYMQPLQAESRYQEILRSMNLKA